MEIRSKRGHSLAVCGWTAKVREAKDHVSRMGYREDLLRWVEDINRYDDQGPTDGKMDDVLAQ